jgi:O-antigen ligase
MIVQKLRSCFSVFTGKKELSQTDIDRAAVFLFTISIFLPFYFGLVTVSCIAFMTIVKCGIRKKAFSAPYTKLIFAFLVGSFFVAAAYNNYKGMAYSILIYAIVTCGLYFRSVMTRRLYHLALDTACVASLWCAVTAFAQKALMYTSAPNYRPVSVFTNANYYGMMIEFVVIIALYRIFTNPDRAPFYAAVIGVNFAGLYLTASCSSTVAMVCAAAVILLYKRGSKATAVFFTVIAVCLAVFLLFPGALPRSSMAIETTVEQRLSIWRASWRAFEKTPVFGRGATAYQMIWEQFGGYKTYHSHNLALDTLLNFGIVGAAAICVYLGYQIHLLILRFRYRICRDMDVLVAAALSAVLVHGVTDVTIVWIQTAMLFFLIASSVGIGSAYLEERIRLPQLSPLLKEPSAQAVYLKS